VLEQLLARVLPSSSGPGADEARAIDYVRARLATENPELVAALRDGIGRAEAAGLDADGMLRAWSADRTVPQWQLFRRVRSWAWEGFLCEPRHGGNRGRVGWTRFGITGPPQPRGFTLEELGSPVPSGTAHPGGAPKQPQGGDS
jgi:Gluconate 2-dehydrogenase subunit 3